VSSSPAGGGADNARRQTSGGTDGFDSELPAWLGDIHGLLPIQYVNAIVTVASVICGGKTRHLIQDAVLIWSARSAGCEAGSPPCAGMVASRKMMETMAWRRVTARVAPLRAASRPRPTDGRSAVRPPRNLAKAVEYDAIVPREHRAGLGPRRRHARGRVADVQHHGHLDTAETDRLKRARAIAPMPVSGQQVFAVYPPAFAKLRGYKIVHWFTACTPPGLGVLAGGEAAMVQAPPRGALRLGLLMPSARS